MAKKAVPLTNEEKYEKNLALEKSIECLKYDSYKAQVLKGVLKTYESLGDLNDSKERAVKIKEQIKECEEKAAKYEKQAQAEDKEKIKKLEEERNKKLLKSRITFFVSLLVIAALAVGFIIFHRTDDYAYMRAKMYANAKDYENAYKINKRISGFKDSEGKALLYRYKQACKLMDEGQTDKARLIFKEIRDYKDSNEKICECELTLIDETEIGQSVVFGNYKWRLCEKENGKAFLIKSEPIELCPYNHSKSDVTWADSDVRNYLNTVFYIQNFTEFEKEYILDSEVEVSDNTIYGTFGGENTKDKLFLINESQANQYKDILANFLTDFWLIGPGDEQNKAQFVSMGKVMKEGYRVDDRNIRLRPAMWITYK